MLSVTVEFLGSAVFQVMSTLHCQLVGAAVEDVRHLLHHNSRWVQRLQSEWSLFELSEIDICILILGVYKLLKFAKTFIAPALLPVLTCCTSCSY